MKAHLAGTNIQVKVGDLIGRREPCALCERPGRICGAFLPDEPWLYTSAAPRPNTRRWLLFALCFVCAPAGATPRPEILKRVEAEALRRHRIGAL